MGTAHTHSRAGRQAAWARACANGSVILQAHCDADRTTASPEHAVPRWNSIRGRVGALSHHTVSSPERDNTVRRILHRRHSFLCIAQILRCVRYLIRLLTQVFCYTLLNRFRSFIDLNSYEQIRLSQTRTAAVFSLAALPFMICIFSTLLAFSPVNFCFASFSNSRIRTARRTDAIHLPLFRHSGGTGCRLVCVASYLARLGSPCAL